MPCTERTIKVQQQANSQSKMSDYQRSLSALSQKKQIVLKKKSIDKNKHWLLDSQRFDHCVQQMTLPPPVIKYDDDMVSDTVIFDKETSNSNNGTPPSRINSKAQIKKSAKAPETQGAPKKESRITRDSIVVQI